MNTVAPSTASKRSNTPPWPGIRVELSLTPTKRLSADSAISPIWLAKLTATDSTISDIAGYFAGRTFGGPKFWPAVSPKKTWSGTVAGWVGAAVLGLGFAIGTKAGLSLIVLSVAVSFASQMGDIAESALKRYVEVKDSSALIPGHGGVFDRFDAVLGATVFMLFLTFVLGLPGPQF